MAVNRLCLITQAEYSDTANIEGVKRKSVTALDALGLCQHPRGRQPHLRTFRWAGLSPKGWGLGQSPIGKRGVKPLGGCG